MDKKKLIGTIIGVTMFAALIAGATFAWLTFNASVTNGTYNATAQNFIITYAGGTHITELLDIESAPTAANVTKVIKVSASRASTSATGTLDLKLTTSSTGTLTTGSVVKYAVCSGTNSASDCASKSLATVNSTNKVIAVGSVNKTGTITLYTASSISTSATYYYIYFWIDAATFTNSHLGQSFSGYVHASATQN